MINDGTTPTTIQKTIPWLVGIAAFLVFFGWLMVTPPGLMGKADAIGYAVCHRIEVRSFQIDGRALPLCARCSGMYLGAVIGLVYQAIIAPRRTAAPPWKVITPLVLFFLAFGIDGSNSYLYLLKQTQPGILPQIPNIYIPNNTLRLFTGSGMGLAIAAALFPAFNQTIWKRIDPRPALDGLKSFGILVAIVLVFNLLVLTNNHLILYPLAIISSFGVVFVLTLVYSMVWVIIWKADNKHERFSQMWVSLLAGFTIAMLQIGVINMVRFWLTGTWGAFPL